MNWLGALHRMAVNFVRQALFYDVHFQPIDQSPGRFL
jgi:hypothetical protein